MKSNDFNPAVTSNQKKREEKVISVAFFSTCQLLIRFASLNCNIVHTLQEAHLAMPPLSARQFCKGGGVNAHLKMKRPWRCAVIRLHF